MGSRRIKRLAKQRDRALARELAQELARERDHALARELARERDHALAQELQEAYDAARRQDLSDVAAAGDEALGCLVDSLAATARMVAAHDASRAEQIDALRRTAELNVAVTTSHGMPAWSQAATARRVVVTEVASVLRIPDRSAETLIEESRMLVEELHATLDGLRAGAFSYRHAKSVIEHASSLSEELRTEFEQRVLQFAADLTPSKFDRKARETRERMDATTIHERHLRAVEDRQTFWEPARDGMAWLHIYDTASNTRAAYDRATDLAIALTSPSVAGPESIDRDDTDADARTLMQRRTDVTIDLLLNGDVPHSGYNRVRPAVTLTIPALSLLGHASASGEVEPAILDGYGPIDIDTARDLAGSAKSWLRVLTHPVTGVVLSVDSRKRKIPTGLRNWLRLRDGTCRMVGCNRGVTRCDLDHNEEWQNGGRHSHDNLGHLCPKHHDEKHHTPLYMRHLPNGDIEWTMASGRTYISAPAVRMDGHAA